MKLFRHAIQFAFLTSFFTAAGQQFPLFTQYREYYSFINPALPAQEYVLLDPYRYSAGLSYRYQWTGVPDPDPPRSFMLSFDSFLFENVSKPKTYFVWLIGMHLLGRQTNPLQRYGLYPRLAAGISFTGKPASQLLSIGFNPGLVFRQFNTRHLQPYHVNDPQLAQLNGSQTRFDLGWGISYWQRFNANEGHQFFVGLSSPQLFGSRDRSKEGHFPEGPVFHGYFLGGLIWGISKYIQIEFSTWVKYARATPLHCDFNARIIFNPFFWSGIGISPRSFSHLEAGLYLSCQKGKFGLGADGPNLITIGVGFDRYKSAGVSLGDSWEMNVSFTRLID